MRSCSRAGAAAAVERRAALGRRIDEDRQAELRRRCARRRPAAAARAPARSRRARAGRSAPRRPRRPADARRRAPRRSMRSTATAIPASSASASSCSLPTSVKTERLWSTSVCTSSSRACCRERRADRVDRRAVAPFAEVRNGLERQHARTLGRCASTTTGVLPSTTTGISGAASSPTATVPAGTTSSASSPRSIGALPVGANTRRRLRHGLSDPPSARRRRRARPERADARGGGAPVVPNAAFVAG